MPAPIITLALAGLVLMALLIGSGRLGAGDPHPTARVGRTRAKLFDGTCVFAADIELDGRLSALTFDRRYLDIKGALVDLLRTKSAYMVRTNLARESLRQEMLREMNRVAGHKIARQLTFSEFLLL